MLSAILETQGMNNVVSKNNANSTVMIVLFYSTTQRILHNVLEPKIIQKLTQF